MTDIQKIQQEANDLLEAVSGQRNAAQSECLNLYVQLKAAQRASAEKDAKIADLETKLAEATKAQTDLPLETPKSNGHDAATVN